MIPVDMKEMYIDILTFTGHKSLYGPMGIGGIYAREGVDVRPLREGGTGVNSSYPFHLEEYPFRLECGTMNIVGVAGLNAGQKFLRNRGMENIYNHEMELFNILQEGLAEIPGITIHGTKSLENRVPVVSVTFDNMSPADVGIHLDVDHDVAVRTGLECAPLVHETLNTAPKGTVRFSIGAFNTKEHIIQAVEAVKDIATT
jgi:selenocysteine lyase/cysteine desulfurase